MKRRVLLAATITVILGQAGQVLGEPIELALPTGELPSRLGMSHVYEVRALTDRLIGMARYYGGQAGLFGDAVKRYMRWMEVPATDAVTAQLAAALAELHTEAGWCCHDSGQGVPVVRWHGRLVLLLLVAERAVLDKVGFAPICSTSVHDVGS